MGTIFVIGMADGNITISAKEIKNWVLSCIAVARDIKLGGLKLYICRLLGVDFGHGFLLSHTRIPLVERLNFFSIEKSFDFYFPLPFHMIGL